MSGASGGRVLVLSVIVLISLLASGGGAATIHVSAAGNDQNPGTLQQPVATPARGLALARDGDAVYLGGGQYVLRRFLWIDKPGITLGSLPGQRAVLLAGTDEKNDPAAVVCVAADRVTLADLEIRGGSYYGVHVIGDRGTGSSGVTIRNCRIGDSGRDCIKTLNADRLLIEECRIGPSGVRDPSNAEGIDSIGSKGVIIRNCFIRDTATTGVYLKGGARDGVVERCRIENARNGAGIFLGQDTDLEWMRDGASQEAIDCVARNNVIVRTGAAGVGTCSGMNVRFENNTLVEVAGTSQAGLWVVTNSRGVPSRKVTFRNNIVVVSGERPFVQSVDLADSLAADTNLYHSTRKAGRFCEEVRGDAPRFETWTLAQWQAQRGADRRSVVADPLLVAEAGYRPAAGSPAIGRGQGLTEVRIDIAGRPRGREACDIGAHEQGIGQEASSHE